RIDAHERLELVRVGEVVGFIRVWISARIGPPLGGMGGVLFCFCFCFCFWLAIILRSSRCVRAYILRTLALHTILRLLSLLANVRRTRVVFEVVVNGVIVIGC